jgi:hypothetical protein
MQNFIFGFILVICLIGLAVSDEHGENAVSFTKQTFNEAIANEEILFVMFYAPW